MDNFNLSHPPLMCLEEMIKWTLENQEKETVIHFKKTMKPIAFLKEFCTIKFCLPRRAGHSTAGTYLANKYFNNPIFLVHDSYQREVAAMRLEKMWNKENIYTFDNFRGIKSVECVVIDTASFMSKTSQEYIYNLDFNTSKKNLILFLE